MFKLTNVSKKYKNNIVVESVSIDMSSPGLYIFQGINGSGKSTILKILAGIIYKTDGRIEKDVTVSYLPDKFNLPKLMKTKDYIKSILEMYGKKDLFDDILSKFQIPNRRIGELSKGNIQKVGLVQILYNDADCYVLDEAIDGLDEYAKRLLKDIIKEYIDAGKIIIMSLHNKTLFNDLNPITFDIKDGFINVKKKKRKKEMLENEEKEELQDIIPS